MSQKGHHDIYIIQVGDEYRVRPPIWSHAGKSCKDPKIRNLTDKKVLLVFPGALTTSGDDEQVTLDPSRVAKDPLAKDHGTVALKKLDAAEVPVACPYSVIVFTPSGPKFASGESEPVVIIDPPPA
jgi:hypothetical protein